MWTFVVLSGTCAAILQLFRGYIAKWLYAPVTDASRMQAAQHSRRDDGEEEDEGGYNALGF